MKSFYKTLLILIAIAYVISPIDLIPDFLVPYIGWLDDAFIIGLIIYYLKFNRLPPFFYRHGETEKNRENNFNRYNGSSFSNGNQEQQQNRNGQGRGGNHNQRNGANNDQRQKSRTTDHGAGSKAYNEQPNGAKSKKSPYDILGVDINATKEEIHAAYRKLVKQYHPDRVAHLGKEFQDLANKKFIEIKDAYNTLMTS